MQKGIFILLNLLFIQFSISAKEEEPKTDSIKTHSFKRAMIYSAVIPGAGQIYNHRAMPKGKKKAYWKVPLIYAGLGTSAYFAFTNLSQAKAYRTEVEYRKESGSMLNFQEFDSLGLVSLYKQARNNRDLLFLGMGFVYLLNIADAGVEAHFVSFDVSEEISFTLQPSFRTEYAVGLSVQMNFRHKPRFVSAKF